MKDVKRRSLCLILPTVVMIFSLAEGDVQAASVGGQGVEIGRVFLALILILLAAKIGGELAERIRQPAVLGELVFGVILGNLALVGYHGLEFLKADQAVELLAQIGVVLLLFEVGLESNLKEMMGVGLSSFLVALLGVITPFVLGWGVGAWFLPQENPLVHVFLGATLTATSVGITARVLKDLGKIKSQEGKIILGAAVVDDVMGLVILAGVTGIISAANTGGSGISAVSIALIIGKAMVFLVGALVLGVYLSPRLFKLASRLRVHGVLLTTSISGCFLLAYLASEIELAPIVGAFAAGLILDPVHYRDFTDRGEHGIEELIRPITTFLVPIFFVLMGIRVDLTTFARVEILGFAAVLTLAAMIGKQACALGVVEKGLDRLSVGIGMIPRGEVGLIFAGIGSSMVLRGELVVSSSTFSAVVIMVIVTTLATPPVLKLSLNWGEKRQRRQREMEAVGRM